MKVSLKHIWAVGLVLMLLMFAVMFFNDHRWRGALQGDIEYQEKPEFIAKAWFDGEYQKDMQKYLEENIGLRNYFIRSRNQIYFSVFHEAKAQNVEIGSENVFYETDYLKEYFGENAIDRKEMSVFVSKAKMVVKALKAEGKTLLFVVAPGKASIYPDHFPSKWYTHSKSLRNRDYFVNELNKNELPVMDASSWFVDLNKNTNYPLFSETGIHWTHYGEYVFMDSLSNYLNASGFNVPSLEIEKMEVKTTPVYPDDDIEQGMNLLLDIPNKPLAYPKIRFSMDKKRSSAMLIGDSYLYNMFVTKFYKRMFHKYWYYYYNEDRYAYNDFLNNELNQKIRTEDLKQTDCVILLCTEATLNRLYFNSINNLYDAMHLDKSTKKVEK